MSWCGQWPASSVTSAPVTLHCCLWLAPGTLNLLLPWSHISKTSSTSFHWVTSQTFFHRVTSQLPQLPSMESHLNIFISFNLSVDLPTSKCWPIVMNFQNFLHDCTFYNPFSHSLPWCWLPISTFCPSFLINNPHPSHYLNVTIPLQPSAVHLQHDIPSTLQVLNGL